VTTGYPEQRHSYIKEAYYLLCLVLVVVIFLFTVWGSSGHLELMKAEAQLKTQKERVKTLKQENAKKLQAIEQLRSDPRALEKYARSKNYAQAGEIIQQLPEENSPKP
jgi:cell division protein FtsB